MVRRSLVVVGTISAALLVVGVAAATSIDTGATAFWLPNTTQDGGVVGTGGTSIAIAPDGSIHMTYTIVLEQDGGHRPAYYVACSTSCADPDAWARTRLSDDVFDARLALDRVGNPRVMLYSYLGSGPTDGGTPKEYRYAACDATCDHKASWTITPIAQSIMYDADRAGRSNAYFALDRQGRPGFVYADTSDHDDHGGTFLDWCRAPAPSDCTDASAWQEITLASTYLLADAVLSFAPDGGPRVMGDYVSTDEGVDTLVYAECDPTCASGGATRLPFGGGGWDSLSLQLNHQGRPRAVFFTGNSGGNSVLEPFHTAYLWCDSGCTQPGHWSSADLHTSPGHGWNVDLALDASDHPRFVYQQGDVGPGYAWCDAACEGTDATWHAVLAEDRQVLEQQNPVNPLLDCSESSWTSGHLPSLALDADGNPRMGYDTRHSYGGTDLRPGHHGEPCPIESDVVLARFLMMPSP
jgi:hypothetical protein